MLIFGLLLNDNTMILVNLFGAAINICYLSVYYAYTNEAKGKAVVFNQFGYAGAFLLVILAYAYVENSDVLLFRYGILVTTVMFGFVGWPLLSLVRKFKISFSYN